LHHGYFFFEKILKIKIFNLGTKMIKMKGIIVMQYFRHFKG